MTETYNNYNSYTGYTMADMTTIRISKETRDDIATFGTKDDTYDDIVRRLYDLAVETQLRRLLTDTEGTITLDEAERRHKRRWSTSSS